MRKLKVKAIRRRSLAIKEFELVHPEGGSLSPFTAGSHVYVTAPGYIARPFSLCNDPAETHRYVLAVLREPHGRGGSKAMHDKVALGHLLDVSEPANEFPLDEASTGRIVLIAGGIGATPLLAMAYRLNALGRPFDIHYCVSARDRLAFLPDFQALIPASRLHLHISDGRPECRLNADRVVEHIGEATIYCCGPPSLNTAVERACANQQGIRFRSEQFKAEVPDDATAFEVELGRSGRVVRVSNHESILVALWRAGYPRPFSCEVGICGACRTRYLAGDPEHKDHLLSAEERRDEVLICISRSRSCRLTLDI